MMKVFYVVPTERQPPLLDFMNMLEPKLQQKLCNQFLLLSKPPLPREPTVKHFTIEKYSRLYELRAKSKVMVRIIFTMHDNNILLCVISAQDSQYEFLSSLFFSCMFSRLTDYARRDGVQGRLPVTVNFLLEEFCNIGKLVDFKRELAVLRGFNINCQLVVQSAAGLADRYPKDEWEELISHCDTMICLGANDMKTANYISDKCGSVTIRVDNNQMPLMPLFSPIYSSTRPYSQTRSNTKRALMMPDEILRMDNKKCLVLLRGQKPLMLDKIVPEEFPVFENLKYTKITDYIPLWRKDEPPPAPPPPPSAPPSTPEEKLVANKTSEQIQMPGLDIGEVPEVQNNEIPAENNAEASIDNSNLVYAVVSHSAEQQQTSSATPDYCGGLGEIDSGGEVTIDALKSSNKNIQETLELSMEN